MAKPHNRDVRYFDSRPDIVRIFDDLEALHDWCRFEMAPFDPKFLYSKESWVWRNFDKTRKGKKTSNNGRKHNTHNKRYTNQ
jgi:hypothetical protein